MNKHIALILLSQQANTDTFENYADSDKTARNVSSRGTHDFLTGRTTLDVSYFGRILMNIQFKHDFHEIMYVCIFGIGIAFIYNCNVYSFLVQGNSNMR